MAMTDEFLEYRTMEGMSTKHLLIKNPEPKGLVVILPGANNLSEIPVLYLIRKGVSDEGYDTLNVDYEGLLDRDLNKEVLFDRLISMVKGLVNQYVETYGETEVSIVGRSLGSIIGARMSAETEEPFKKVVYISPTGLTIEELKTGEGLMFTSYADEYMDEAAIEKVKGWEGIELHLYNGADHSLEREGDLDGTIDVIRDVVKRSVEYLTS